MPPAVPIVQPVTQAASSATAKATAAAMRRVRGPSCMPSERVSVSTAPLVAQ